MFEEEVIDMIEEPKRDDGPFLSPVNSSNANTNGRASIPSGVGLNATGTVVGALIGSVVGMPFIGAAVGAVLGPPPIYRPRR